MDLFKRFIGSEKEEKAGTQQQALGERQVAAAPLHLTAEEFDRRVLHGEGTVVVDFWAEWCGPCRAIAPILEQLAVSYNGRVRITKLDVDANQRTTMKFNVRSIPALLFFKDGRHVDTIVGLTGKSTLEARIDKHLAA